MKNLLLIPVISLFVLLAGCNKDTSTASGNNANWVGTYNSGAQSGLTQVQITSSGANSLRIVFKVEQDWYLYTATTLQTVKISGSNNAVINENQDIIEATDLGQFNFQGTVSLNGNNLTLNAVATSVGGNSENSPMNFSFSGVKVQ